MQPLLAFGFWKRAASVGRDPGFNRPRRACPVNFNIDFQAFSFSLLQHHLLFRRQKPACVTGTSDHRRSGRQPKEDLRLGRPASSEISPHTVQPIAGLPVMDPRE